MCPFHEVKTHPTKTKNPLYFSFKHKRAGLLYEVGMSIHEERCVWINGPYPGGKTNDKGVFNDKLRAKIPAGKRVLGDSGYDSKRDSDIVTTKRVKDSAVVRKVKRRVLARHEDVHKSAFEAVAVICQYQLELGSPLFERVNIFLRLKRTVQYGIQYTKYYLVAVEAVLTCPLTGILESLISVPFISFYV
jgi:hypothetical protein